MSKTITIERDSGQVTIEQTAAKPTTSTEAFGIKLSTGHIASDVGVIVVVLALVYAGKKYLDKKWK